MEDKKIGFFSRVKIAVCKLENYNIFIEETTSNAIKYFFKIVLILSIVMACVQTYTIMKLVKKGYNYIINELPDFIYENRQLQFSENVYVYDEEYDIYLIADTGDIDDNQLTEYKNQIKSNGLIFLKDRLIYISGNSEANYYYGEYENQYDITTLDKNSFIEKIDSIGFIGIGSTLFIFFLILVYINETILIFIDWLIILMFAYVSARICKLNLSFKQAFNIGIYALTLSIILTMFYNVAYYLFGFYTNYFKTVYMLISYVYVVAVILMIKSDLAKQYIEVEKTQNEVHKEMIEQEKTKEENKDSDKNEKKNNENENNQEQDGSEI